jgi:1,3-beta-glucanosyltransferase GAS5
VSILAVVFLSILTITSLSEYGCITNTRTWEETAALYNTEMTSVYSGGLAYEYSMEANGYGMVQINTDGTITELPNFASFKSQLANNPGPSDSGGASSTQAASTCPTQSPNWNITDDSLPAIPDGAAAVSVIALINSPIPLT